MSIRKKLMLSFFLVVLVPVVFVGVFLTGQYRQNVLKQATEQTIQSVERIKSRTEELLGLSTEVSTKLATDTQLMNTVNTEYRTTLDVFDAYWNFKAFEEDAANNEEIAGIRFYTTNRTMLDNLEFIKVTRPIVESPWYRSAMEEGGIRWFYLPDETKQGNKYLSLVRKVIFPLYRSSGVLVITVDPNRLNGILSQESFDTMIIDEKGTIVASNRRDWTGVRLAELEFARDMGSLTAGTYELRYQGKPSRMIVERLQPEKSRNGLRIVSVFSIDRIVSEANRVSLLGFLIVGASLLVAIVLIFLFSNLLTRRILVLNRELNRVALGDLSIVSNVSGTDEIGLLSRQFNNMVSSIRRLMEEVAESQRQKDRLELRQREIKLKMMASQINPHFLFNALESIRMKAHLRGEAELSSVVRMLGEMIRRNLDVGMKKIRLQEELGIVRNYLEIQKFRYGDRRLDYRIEADSECGSFEIPPLILQPLVENAVVHGLEQIESGGVVTVEIRRMEYGMRFLVSDNGLGIPEDRLRDLRLSLEDMEEEGSYRIGLRNVHQRLRMIYGDDCGLDIRSEEGIGTAVSFQIPLRGA